MRKPRLDAQSPKKVVYLLFVEVDDQIVWPVAGALLVARRRAGHLIVIAVRVHEIPRARFVLCEPGIARKLQRAGYLDQDILQTGGEADDAVGLTLAGDGGLRAIEIVRRCRHGAAATNRRNGKRYYDDGANHALVGPP